MPGSLIYVLNLRVFSECPFLCRYYLVILRYFSFPMASLLYPSLPFPSPPFSSPRLASHPLFSPPLPLLSFHPLSPLPMRFEHDPLKTNKHRWKKTDRQISPYHFPCERTTATTITQLPVKERVKSLLEHKGKTRNEVNSVFSAQTLWSIPRLEMLSQPKYIDRESGGKEGKRRKKEKNGENKCKSIQKNKGRGWGREKGRVQGEKKKEGDRRRRKRNQLEKQREAKRMCVGGRRSRCISNIEYKCVKIVHVYVCVRLRLHP